MQNSQTFESNASKFLNYFTILGLTYCRVKLQTETLQNLKESM